MSYQVICDDARALLTVKYRGATTLSDRLAAVTEGVALLARTGFRRVLVDLSTARLIFEGPAQDSGFANVISSDNTLKHCKTAFVTTDNEYGNDFIEILASAQHYNLRHFTSLDAAYQWLEED